MGVGLWSCELWLAWALCVSFVLRRLHPYPVSAGQVQLGCSCWRVLVRIKWSWAGLFYGTVKIWSSLIRFSLFHEWFVRAFQCSCGNPDFLTPYHDIFIRETSLQWHQHSKSIWAVASALFFSLIRPSLLVLTGRLLDTVCTCRSMQAGSSLIPRSFKGRGCTTVCMWYTFNFLNPLLQNHY